MHGIVFSELKKFVESNYDRNVWTQLLDAAGLSNKTYMPNQPYPDEELVDIVTQACILTGATKEALLESFGKFIVPDLIAIFKYTIQPTWKTLDLVENVEVVIHKAVRINNKGATPPRLTVSRVSNSLVEIVYQSERKMEHLGVGIIKGIANHFNESIVINCKSITPGTSLITVRA